MVTKLVTLSPEMHVSDGTDRLLKNRITGAPVVDPDQNFLGVFSEKCWMKVLGALAGAASEGGEKPVRSIPARDFMVSKLVTLKTDTDALDAICLLLKNRISGAPVVDNAGKFLGVFSEKSSMHFMISSAYEQLPTTHVGAFMNQDCERIITGETDLFEVARKFKTTPFRRLEVVDPDSGRLLGQISRRDVMQAEQQLPDHLRRQVMKKACEMGAENAKSRGEALQQDGLPRIVSLMDRDALTIGEDVDFLGIARIFMDTPYRRLPVLREGQVVGQISRRDVLDAANKLIAGDQSPREKTILYLSSLMDRQDAPFG
jgi:CBS domain-containing protein